MRAISSALSVYLITVASIMGLDGCSESQRTDGAIRVPFQLERNRIIVKVGVNGSRPLNLILDTGMPFDGVYLFHEELTREIDMTGAQEYRVGGAGDGEASNAVMIHDGRLAFGDVIVDSQPVLISKSPQTQSFRTDGTIGWNLFGHYVVEVDYDHSSIYLHDPQTFAVGDGWTELPVEMHDGLPFLTADVEVVSGEVIPLYLYIDLASGDALELLTRESQAFSLPDSLTQSYLGTGLSGDVYGHYGVTERINLGGFDLHKVQTAFAPAEVRSRQEHGDGIIGNALMSRFNVIFDYARSRLYLRPSKTFDRP